MSLTKPNSGDPGYSGATKASTVIGAIVDAVNHVFDVKAYGGAAGDGSTDDTAAIQNAITAAQAAGGTVLVPGATYKVTGSGLTLDPTRAALLGQGAVLSYAGSGTALTIQQPNTSPTYESPRCSGFRISTSTGATGVLIEAQTPASLTFPAVRGLLENVQVNGFSGAGFKLDGALAMTLLNCYATACQDGLLIANSSNSTAVLGGAYRSNSRAGIHVDTSANSVTDVYVSPTTVMESNSSYGFLYDGTNDLLNAVIGGHYENNTTRGLYFNGGSSTVGLVESAITGALISMPNGASDTGLEIVNCSRVQLGSIAFTNSSQAVFGSGTRDIWSAAVLRGVTITDNGKRNNTLAADSIAAGTVTGTQFSNLVKAKRWATSGSNLVSGDIALSAGWGNTASVAFSNNSSDGRFRISVTCNGTGIAANPTVTLTFHDGTWSAAPHGVVSRADIAAPTTGWWAKTGQTATTWTLTFVGTPVAASVYIVDGIAVGQ